MLHFRSYIVSLVLLVIIVAGGCKKTNYLTSGGLVKFSVDTLKFDTVFTAAGSFTNGLLIFNPQNEAITLSRVRLANGATSYFHLNVDGFKGNSVTNIKIAPHDSVYVFATVNINPTDTNLPFMISDNLIATLNGKDFSVPITAYGQNAHYIVGDSLYGTTTWLTDKPYVVVHACVVGPGATLNIPNNCKVYMHQDARFFVYGTMNVGTGATTGHDSVVFQGDRLDRAYFGYKGYPGEWGGFYFVNGAQGNFRNAVVKNCGGATPYYNYGIQSAAFEVDSGGVLVLSNTIVKNSIGHGLLSFGGQITATNCLVADCGGEALAMILGGKDSMTNCTFANYSTFALTHSDNPTVGLVNWLQVGQNQYIYSDMEVAMHNCIVWGSLDSEFVCDTSGSLYSGSHHIRTVFDHCILKKGSIQEPLAQFVGCNPATDNDPKFKDTNTPDFHIQAGSPAINAGNSTYTPTYDLEGKARTGNDLGCYQH